MPCIRRRSLRARLRKPALRISRHGPLIKLHHLRQTNIQALLVPATALARELTEMCDFVRTEQVLFSGPFNQQLKRLNKVLYG